MHSTVRAHISFAVQGPRSGAIQFKGSSLRSHLGTVGNPNLDFKIRGSDIGARFAPSRLSA